MRQISGHFNVDFCIRLYGSHREVERWEAVLLLRDVRREPKTVDFSVAAVFGLNQHIANDGLVDPSPNALETMLCVDEPRHLVLPVEQEGHFGSAGSLR